MKQHSINLITLQMLERARTGARTRRIIFACILLLIGMLLTATHSRLNLDQVETHHESTVILADRALELEDALERIDVRMTDVRSFMSEYRDVALPLEVTRLIATLTRSLPPSVTLVELEMNYDDGTTSRRHIAEGERGPRRLVGEIAGVASSDGDIASLVHMINTRDPFSEVNLDYSRSRTVRGQSARDFRLSFIVNLDHAFQVHPMAAKADAGEESE